jgi:ketopantoate reductase
MVCRSNYEQVKQHGIEIESGTFGTYRMRPSSVFSSIAEAAERGPSSGSDRLMSSSWDYVILCTKVLPDRVDDAELVAPLLQIPELGGPVPTLVLIQNGVGFEDGHRQRHPLVPILSAVSVVNAEQLAPGYVRHNHWTRISIGPYLAFDGYLEQHVTHPPISQQLQSHSQAQLELLLKLFMNGQIADAEMYGERDLQILRWHKLAIKSVQNKTKQSLLLICPPSPYRSSQKSKFIDQRVDLVRIENQCIHEPQLDSLRGKGIRRHA